MHSRFYETLSIAALSAEMERQATGPASSVKYPAGSFKNRGASRAFLPTFLNKRMILHWERRMTFLMEWACCFFPPAIPVF